MILWADNICRLHDTGDITAREHADCYDGTHV